MNFNIPSSEPSEVVDEKFKKIQPESKSLNEKNFTLLLDLSRATVEMASLKETAEKNGMEAKAEFHVTVLGFKNGNEINKLLKKMTPDDRQKTIAEIQKLIDETDWSFSPSPDRYHISKEYVAKDPKTGVETVSQREAYIQKLEMTGMKSFYEKVNALLGTAMEAPPAHITLFTGGSDKDAKMGIGITSEAELEKMNPELIQV